MPVTLQMQAEADVSDAINAFHSVGTAADGAGAAFEDSGQKGGGMLSKIGGGLSGLVSLVNPIGLATTAVTTLGPALLNAGKAASDENAEIAQLTNTLKNNVPGWDGNTAAIDAAVAAGQKKAFVDSDLRASLGLLATDTGDVNEAIRLQGIAMDLAAQKGIPLSQATKLISKADDESYSALSKLGIEIEKGTSREDALAAIHAKTAGAADVFAASAEGAGIRLQSSMGDAMETIGGVVAPLMNTAMGALADAFVAIGPIIQGVADFLSAALAPALGAAQGLFAPVQAAVTTVVGAFTAFTTGGTDATTALSGVTGGLGPLGAILTTVGTAIGTTAAAFSDIAGNVFAAVSSALSTSILPALTTLGDYLGTALPPIISALAGFWTGTLLPAITQVWNFITSTVIPIAGELVGWLIEQIPGALTFLGNVWTTVLQPAIAGVWDHVQSDVIPIIQTLFDWLSVNLPPAIQGLADFWTTTLQPAIAQVGDFLVTTVFPALGTLLGWLADQIPPAISALANFWTTTLQPAINSVWSFITTTVFPMLQTLFNWLSVTIPPAIQTLADFWTTTLQPALQTVWDFLDKNILPILGTLISVGLTPVQTAVSALAGVWNTVLAPALTKVADVWNTTLKPAVEAMASFLGGTLKGAIDGIGSAINGVIQFLRDLANGLANVKLPDWMTPGSPTPWEIGLVGVGKAMRDLTGGPLPTLARQLDALPAPGLLGASAHTKGGPAVLPGAGGAAVPGGETVFSVTLVLPDGTVVGSVKDVRLSNRKAQDRIDLRTASYRP